MTSLLAFVSLGAHGLVGLLISLLLVTLVVVIIVYCVDAICAACGFPAPVPMLIKLILGLIVLLWVIDLLFGGTWGAGPILR